MLVAVGVGMPTATAASGSCPHRFGSPQQLTDAGGAVVQQWSVSDLRASADTAPGYLLAGRLWEATASVEALTGAVTPMIPNVYAVSASGERYQVLWQVASPSSIAGATISQGQTSTGKVYFDVTGADPMAVIYTNGGSMPAMMWCCNGNMMMPMQMPMPMPMERPMPMAMDDCPDCTGTM
nr:DUF1942 domain-containing protein [Mycolicibacterium tusciae]